MNAVNPAKATKTSDGGKMTRMSKTENVEAIERVVHLWLRVRRISQSRYENLSPWDKEVLHKALRGQLTDHTQRVALWQNLGLQGCRAGEYFRDEADLTPPYEELQKFFSLTADEKSDYLYGW